MILKDFAFMGFNIMISTDPDDPHGWAASVWRGGALLGWLTGKNSQQLEHWARERVKTLRKPR